MDLRCRGGSDAQPAAPDDRLGLQQQVGGRAAHARAAAAPTDDVALGAQLVERQADGVAGDAEVGGERARGRESRAGDESAAEDRLAQPVVDLAVNGTAR